MLRVQSASITCLRAASSKAKGARIKTFEIYRYNPDKTGSKPTMEVIFELLIGFVNFDVLEV